jgi:hypothetical protein
MRPPGFVNEEKWLEKAFFDGFMAGQASGRLEGRSLEAIEVSSAWLFWQMIYCELFTGELAEATFVQDAPRNRSRMPQD